MAMAKAKKDASQSLSTDLELSKVGISNFADFVTESLTLATKQALTEGPELTFGGAEPSIFDSKRPTNNDTSKQETPIIQGNFYKFVHDSMGILGPKDDTLLSILGTRIELAGGKRTHAGELLYWLDCGIELLAAGATLPEIEPPGRPRQAAKATAAPEKAKRQRPDLPGDMQWPEGDYGMSPEAKRGSGGGFISYLERVWLPILEAGRRDGKIYVDRRIIDDWYPGIIKAIKNYRARDQHGARRDIPEHLRFPTEREVNDLEIGDNALDAVKRNPRLGGVIGGRLARGEKVPGM